MANLPESSNWDANVYQIETTDDVVGGVNGVANLQAKALANRTKWLKDWLESGNNFLTRLLAVDGAGSGIDADKLDGLDSVEFLRATITGVDWNVVDTTHASLVSSPTNGPVGGTGYIGVSIANAGGGAYAQQIAARNGALYFRSQENGVWGTWNKIWHANNDGSSSGLDADLLRGLPADFSASLATSGWQKLPSGLILQWGSTGLINLGSPAVVTFPLAFPTACYVFNPGAYNGNNGAAYLPNVTGLSVAGVSISAINYATYCHWLAIGK